MTDTATPETGPVDAPASIESMIAEMKAGDGESPEGDVQNVVDELVNDAKEAGEPSPEEPEPEDDATEPAEEAAEPDEGTPESNEQLVTVKVNGEERQVPLSEALAGYSRTEDYKAKTAAVAEARREAEAVRANAVAEAKAHYANQLEEATNLFAQHDPVLAEARTINWDALKQADPAAYVQAQDAVQQRLTAIQQMQAQVQQARGEAEAHRQQQTQDERAKRFDAAAAKIVETMPELADEAKFEAFAGDAIGYLRNEGFEGEEIAEVLDHRVLTLADKARRWDAHLAAQKSLPEKRVVPKSAVKPLVSDGLAGSRSRNARFPSSAPRDRQLDWAVQQMKSEG